MKINLHNYYLLYEKETWSTIRIRLMQHSTESQLIQWSDLHYCKEASSHQSNDHDCIHSSSNLSTVARCVGLWESITAVSTANIWSVVRLTLASIIQTTFNFPPVTNSCWVLVSIRSTIVDTSKVFISRYATKTTYSSRIFPCMCFQLLYHSLDSLVLSHSHKSSNCWSVKSSASL